LTVEEKAKVLPLVLKEILPYWQQYCSAEADLARLLAERSAHYLRSRHSNNQLKTANGIVNALIEAIGPENPRDPRPNMISGLLAHRMLSDMRRLGEIKANYSLE